MFIAQVGGCMQAGMLAYVAGMVPKQKVPAEFTLPKGPVLILVDDDQDMVQPPTVKQLLVDALAKQLREHEITERVTTNEELARVRQSDPKFDQRGTREVGQAVGADTVMWLSIRQFALERDLELAVTPAQLVLTLKVVNAKADKRDDVRLWPLDREGRLMEVSMSANDLHKVKARTEVYEKLADDMADKIARLFYDYEVEQ